MKRICVFCGSSKGNSEKFIQLAESVGRQIGQSGWGLVYGGGNVGLMGAVANSAQQNGSEVIGVIPKLLMTREMAHFEVSKLHVVEDMHERKRMMYDFSDAFLILPGGMGTLDELFEITTWAQLGLHAKPIYLLNEFGFYDDLVKFLQGSNAAGFIRSEHLGLIRVLSSASELNTFMN